MRKHYIQKPQHDKGIFKPIRVLIACLILLVFLFNSVVFAFNGSSVKDGYLRAVSYDERPGAGQLRNLAAEQVTARKLMEELPSLIQQMREDLSSGVEAYQKKTTGGRADPELSALANQLLSNPANAIIQRIDQARARIDELEHAPLQVTRQLHELARKFSLHLRDVFENYFNKPGMTTFAVAETRYGKVIDTADRELSATEKTIDQHWAYFKSRTRTADQRASRRSRRTRPSGERRPTRQQPREGTLGQILSQNSRLAEQGFEGILGAMLFHFGSIEAMVEAMQGLGVVELGPSSQLAMLEFLRQLGVNITGIGRGLNPAPNIVPVADYNDYFMTVSEGTVGCIYAKLSLDHASSTFDQRFGARAIIMAQYMPMVSRMSAGAVIIQQTRSEETEARLTAEQAAMVGLEIVRAPYRIAGGDNMIMVYAKKADGVASPGAIALRIQARGAGDAPAPKLADLALTRMSDI